MVSRSFDDSGVLFVIGEFSHFVGVVGIQLNSAKIELSGPGKGLSCSWSSRCRIRLDTPKQNKTFNDR